MKSEGKGGIERGAKTRQLANDASPAGSGESVLVDLMRWTRAVRTDRLDRAQHAAQ